MALHSYLCFKLSEPHTLQLEGVQKKVLIHLLTSQTIFSIKFDHKEHDSSPNVQRCVMLCYIPIFYISYFVLYP